MKVVGVELYCQECGYEERHEDECLVPNYGHSITCPKCRKAIMCRSPFVVCHCGTTVYLSIGDTECEGCGQAYNAFGDEITHMGFTEEDY